MGHRASDRPVRDFLGLAGPVLLAHRGGALEGLENSPSAFMRCADLGLSYVETDVRASRDGQCVIIHDATLDRVTDGAGAVRDQDWRDLQSLSMTNGDALMSLEQALERFGQLRFNIDVKCDDAVLPFLATLRRTGAWDRVCAASFADHRLARMRRLAGPRLATSAGTAEVARMVTRTWAGPQWRGAPGPVAAQVPMRIAGLPIVTTGFVRAVHDWGMLVHVWTVDDPAVIHRLLALGVDGIVTDRPVHVTRALAQRPGGQRAPGWS